MTRGSALILTLFLCVFFAGCSRPSPRAVPPPEPVVEKSPRPDVLAEMKFSVAQGKKIDALLSRLYARFADYDEARLVLLDEAIVQIEAGKLDRDKLEPLARRAVKTFEEAFPTFLDGMNELHAILTEKQRQELIERLEGPDEKEMTDEERELARQERISRLLDLSTGQKARLYPSFAILAMGKWGLISHYRDGIGEAREAFLSDEFDAHELRLAKDLRAWEVAELMYDAIELTMGVLNPEQRKALSDLLDARYR